MEEEWLHGIIPDSGISDEDLARIKAENHEQIGTRKQFTLKRVLKWTQIAAAIALPICMVIMGMMYKENKQYAAIPLTEITTQEGEQVSITLPDIRSSSTCREWKSRYWVLSLTSSTERKNRQQKLRCSTVA